jgi:hypothetical protein
LFPRHHKQSRAIDDKQINSAASSSSTLTVEAVENAAFQAYSHAIRVVRDVNMYQQYQISSLKEMSKLVSIQLQKSQIVDYSHLNEHDPDFDSDSDDSTSADGDDGTSENDTNNEDLSDDDDESYLNDHLFNVS